MLENNFFSEGISYYNIFFFKDSQISEPNLNIDKRSGSRVFKNPYCNPVLF